MTDEARVVELVEEALVSDREPEAVCAADPALAAEVRRRWERCRAMDAELGALFPVGPGGRSGSLTVPAGDGGTTAGGPVPADARDPSLEVAEGGDRTGLPRVPGYEVTGVLGRGGMGIVYRARHLPLRRAVALKMLLAGPHADPRELARFRREAEAVAALRHPHVVQVYDVGEQGGQPYFTMELVDGGTLARRLDGAPRPAAEAADLVARLADAADAAHRAGVVHRDLKPGNILLAADGTPKVADFGLAGFLAGGDGDDAAPPDGDLTLTGVRLGTPSYMAPEQAMGGRLRSGPAVDVYALGAILYETLTGRPPFRGETAAETHRQAIADDPVPPRRLNPRVPADLQTVCLRCLEKNPARRYPTARALGDDLRRFLAGRPVVARPVGPAVRAAKWARRRPAAAALAASGAVLLALAGGTAVWRQRVEDARRLDVALRGQEAALRQGRARQAIESALAAVDGLVAAERWPEAERAAADAAAAHADAAADGPLAARLAGVRADLGYARRLEAVRQSRVTPAGGGVDFGSPALAYQALFRELGFREPPAGAAGDAAAEDAAAAAGRPSADEAALAARLGRSPVRAQFAAALEDWALLADPGRDRRSLDRFLRLARLVDPTPGWRGRFRSRAAWADPAALAGLAADAPAADPPPTARELGILGELLCRSGDASAGERLLRDAQARRPDEFWLNFALATRLGEARQWAEAVPFARVAAALRPGSPKVHALLGDCLRGSGREADGLRQARLAVDLDPRDPWATAGLIAALDAAGRLDEAIAAFGRARAADPGNWPAADATARALARAGRLDEAIALCRDVLRPAPAEAAVRHNLALYLARAHRYDEALAEFRPLVDADPANWALRYGAGLVLRDQGRLAEAAAELGRAAELADPATVPGVLVVLGDALRRGGRSAEAVAALRRAAEREPGSRPAWQGLASALLDCGRFAEARAAADRRLALGELDDAGRAELRDQQALCDRLQSMGGRLDAVASGDGPPADKADVTDRLAVALWHLKAGRTAAAARLYANAVPTAADHGAANGGGAAGPWVASARPSAARAAALAGCGSGVDAGGLTEPDRAALRGRALAWLTAERDAAVVDASAGQRGDRGRAAAAARSWRVDPAWAGVRGAAALARLPAVERAGWSAFWASADALADADPAAAFERAQSAARGCRWADAAAAYAEAMALEEPDDGGERWFELAACQLLAGDRAGYRRTCGRMLSRGRGQPVLRRYLVARACTLSPDAVPDLPAVEAAGRGELDANRAAFWSLTERAALAARCGRPRDAVPLIEQSLAADARPGTTAVNWAWLAAAHRQLGDPGRAGRWQGRVARWLAEVGPDLPRETESNGLHLHNWLEVHALARESDAAAAATDDDDDGPGR